MAGATPWAWDGQDTSLPANAVACNPGSSIQSTFNANPGKDVWLTSGTHGPQSVTIPAGRSLKGQRQAGTGARLATVDGNNQGIRFVTGSTSGVTVKGIIVTRFYPNYLWGTAVDFRGVSSATPAPNSSIIDCEISYAGMGFGLSSGCQILNSYVHDCDVYGFAASGNGMTIAGNDFYANRDPVFNPPGGDSGMCKIVMSSNSVIRNNYVHGNNGNGIWLDIDNGNNGRNLIHDNLVVGNLLIGIFSELGGACDIYDNEVFDNGTASGSHWPGNAGINVTATTNNRVYNNKLDNNGHGIIFRSDSRRTSSNLSAYGNIVRQPAQAAKGVSGGDGSPQFPYTVVVGYDSTDGGGTQIPAANAANTYYTASPVATWYGNTSRAPGPWGPGLQFDPTGWNALGSALSRTAPDTILTAGAAPPPPPPPPSTITIYPFRLNVGGSEIL